jgi:hypothetical protein
LFSSNKKRTPPHLSKDPSIEEKRGQTPKEREKKEREKGERGDKRKLCSGMPAGRKK